MQTTSEKKDQAMKKIGTATGIWFYAKDIKSVYHTLKSRDVEITKPERQPWDVLMSRYDQDKNEYSLLEDSNLIFWIEMYYNHFLFSKCNPFKFVIIPRPYTNSRNFNNCWVNSSLIFKFNYDSY